MKKIEIFVGSDSAFEKIVPKSARNLSEMAAKLDDGNKKMDVFVNIPGQPEPKSKKKKKPRVQDFVIHADEYCSVQEHVIINFINFIFQMSITNMYIQNPPKNIREQIYRTFDKSIIHETQQPYLEVSKEMIQTFNRQYSERVIGQEKSKKKLLQAIYPLVDGKQSKPVVILLYGDSGLGKTESAQYMAELMGGKLLRKQFSMYQNNESANYIFGGGYNEKSFAQDLLARETNVLLFDEFDKALSIFHSAFYQLIDKGIDIAEVVAIGPVIMMKTVADTTRPYNIKTIVSLNPIMVDGTGMCGGCRVQVGDETKFACVDGPEFDGHLVAFVNLMERQRMYRPKEEIDKDHICRLANKVAEMEEN